MYRQLYTGFGRGGCGAPLRNREGGVVANLGDIFNGDEQLQTVPLSPPRNVVFQVPSQYLNPPPKAAAAKSRLGYGRKPIYTPPQEDAIRHGHQGAFRSSPSLSTAGVKVCDDEQGGVSPPTYGDAYEAAASAAGLATGLNYSARGAQELVQPSPPPSLILSASSVSRGAETKLLHRDSEAEMFRRKNLRSRVFTLAPPRTEADDQMLARLRGTSPRGAGAAGGKVYDTTGVSVPSPMGEEGEIPYSPSRRFLRRPTFFFQIERTAIAHTATARVLIPAQCSLQLSTSVCALTYGGTIDARAACA